MAAAGRTDAAGAAGGEAAGRVRTGGVRTGSAGAGPGVRGEAAGGVASSRMRATSFVSTCPGPSSRTVKSPWPMRNRMLSVQRTGEAICRRRVAATSPAS
ncbi:hypothetical protein [Streptomyces sp. CS62]|uniref:hypothetical protein n=1 Tax=Streptomyces sp. CS62 TaxID=3119268 RepID=UPI002F94B7F7